MKHGRWLVWMLVLVMVVSPLAVFAQGDEVELVEWVSEDELLTVSVPEEWTSGAMEDYPFPHVVSANSQDAFDWLTETETDDNAPRSGDHLMLVTILPLEFLGLMGLVLPEDGEVDVVTLTETLATAFLSDSDTSEFGEAEEVEVGDDLTAGLVTAKDEEGEGVFIVRDLGEGLILLLYVIAAPDEYTDELTELGKQVAGTVVYTGTAEDLIALMMSGFSGDDGSMDDADDEAMGGVLDGEALVAERCTVCHTAERIDKADKDEAGWTRTVDKMIANGAQLNEEERAAVIEYLVETH